MNFRFLDNDMEVAVRCPGCGNRIVETLGSLNLQEALVCDDCGSRKDAKGLVEKLRALDRRLSEPLD